MNQEAALWQIRNEKNKASVRWILVLAIGLYLGNLVVEGKPVAPQGALLFTREYVFSIFGGAVLLNAMISLYLHRAIGRAKISSLLKYLTMTMDFALVALVLLPTGGSASLLYPLNYVIIVSNALRYGMMMAITGTVIMNFFYLGVLAYQYWPQTQIPGFHQEVLKVAGFWLVGIYSGYLSRRFEILRGEVEHYQRLLGEALRKNG